MIQIYGHSDDLVEVEGEVSDEYGAYRRAAVLRIDDHANNTAAIITGEYGKRNGVWSFSVEQVDEGIPLPPIKISTHENGYSPLLTIECSKDITASWLNGET